MVEPARVEAMQTRGLLQLLNAIVDAMKPAQPPQAGACRPNRNEYNPERYLIPLEYQPETSTEFMYSERAASLPRNTEKPLRNFEE